MRRRLPFCRRNVMLAMLGLFASGNFAFCVEAAAGSIAVENAWARATPKGAQVAAGYLIIKNDGEEPDRLVAASAGFAGRTEIHQSSMVDGVMKMRPVADGLAIAPKSTMTLAPGGYHLMFMDLAAPLNEGDSVSVELVFEHAGRVVAAFKVLGMGAQAPDEDAHRHH